MNECIFLKRSRSWKFTFQMTNVIANPLSQETSAWKVFNERAWKNLIPESFFMVSFYSWTTFLFKWKIQCRFLFKNFLFNFLSFRNLSFTFFSFITRAEWFNGKSSNTAKKGSSFNSESITVKNYRNFFALVTHHGMSKKLIC